MTPPDTMRMTNSELVATHLLLQSRDYIDRLHEGIAERDAEIKRLRRKIRQQKTAINGQHRSIRDLKKELKICKTKRLQ